MLEVGTEYRKGMLSETSMSMTTESEGFGREKEAGVALEKKGVSEARPPGVFNSKQFNDNQGKTIHVCS